MSRRTCRRCGRLCGLERWCSAICRLLDRGTVKPEEVDQDWALVTKTAKPAEWGQR